MASRGRPGPTESVKGGRAAAPGRSAPAFLAESLALARASGEPGGGAVWAKRTDRDPFPRSREMVEEEGRAGRKGRRRKEQRGSS